MKRLLWLNEANTYLLGKDERIILSVCAVLSSGHVLIEDHPGVGKTTLAKIIGNLFNFDLSRVQFTNDILPSDIIGSSIFDINKQNFEFHKGPIFGDLVLADELNRAPAKTQSALLQAMEEKKVTVDRQSYDLSPHFTVFATQNPSSQIGTFDLPESQLDRFCLKFDIGYPDKESTLKMLKSDLNSKEVVIHNKISDEQLNEAKAEVQKVRIDDSLFEYIYNLLDYSRSNATTISLSNRAGIDLIKVSRSFAYLKGRDYVIPDDIKYLFPYICGHRLVSQTNSSVAIEHQKAKEILDSVALR